MIRIVELILVVLALVVLVTQVLIPAYANRKMFPMFRESGEVEKELAEVKQEQYEEILKEELEVEKKKLQQVKQKGSSDENPWYFKNLPYADMAKAVALVLVTAANKLAEPTETKQPTNTVKE